MKTLKEIVEEGNTKRRIEDKIFDLLDKEGFHDAYGGRCGTIYYVENRQICELYYELGNGGIVVDINDLTDWIYPNSTAMTDDQKKDIKTKLLQWLDQQKIKVIIV